jgi:DNA-directed RNA polymerase subunit RPC12/RpoP
MTSWFAWLPPALWRCQGCSTTIETLELAPRCPRCGFREGT